MILMDGKGLSAKIKDELKCQIEEYKSIPCLAVISIGENPSSLIYINNKKKACEEVGIGFIHIHYENDISDKKVISKIKELNKDKNVSGIIIQLPLPDSFNERELLNKIDPNKDVDGLTDYSIAKHFTNEYSLIPCTAKGVIELFDYYNINLEGKDVTIIGRSNLVSKPLFLECVKRNATVTMCHSKTKDIKKYTKNVDVIISATGKKDIINKDMIKKDAVIIDIGICYEDNKIYGDVNPNCKELCSYITPVPGGVGPMTVAMLLKNTVIAFKNQSELK